MRPDYRSNLIRLTNENHETFHRHLPEGRVLCLLAKVKKARALKRPEEFVIEELETACGKRIEHVFDLPVDEWCLPYQQELERIVKEMR